MRAVNLSRRAQQCGSGTGIPGDSITGKSYQTDHRRSYFFPCNQPEYVHSHTHLVQPRQQSRSADIEYLEYPRQQHFAPLYPQPDPAGEIRSYDTLSVQSMGSQFFIALHQYQQGMAPATSNYLLRIVSHALDTEQYTETAERTFHRCISRWQFLTVGQTTIQNK